MQWCKVYNLWFAVILPQITLNLKKSINTLFDSILLMLSVFFFHKRFEKMESVIIQLNYFYHIIFSCEFLFTVKWNKNGKNVRLLRVVMVISNFKAASKTKETLSDTFVINNVSYFPLSKTGGKYNVSTKCWQQRFFGANVAWQTMIFSHHRVLILVYQYYSLFI